jgi:hypothetical protein
MLIISSTLVDAGILTSLRERIKPSQQQGPTNRDLRGPSPFAPSAAAQSQYSPYFLVDDGPNAPAGPDGGAIGGYYEDPAGMAQSRGGLVRGGSEVTPQQLNREFAEAGVVSPQDAGANDDDDDFDFDNGTKLSSLYNSNMAFIE